MVLLLKFLITSKNKIQDVIMGKKDLNENKKNNVNKQEYILKLSKILNNLKIKIIFFIITELLLILFFFYFTTAFCEVYRKTQISWLIDCCTSFIMSIFVEVLISFIINLDLYF